jgi:hypothetical protein
MKVIASLVNVDLIENTKPAEGFSAESIVMSEHPAGNFKR